MKISFTGTGCSGKSTLLKMCQEHYGDKFQYVTEVTRPLAREGYKINEEGDDATQEAIIATHIENNKLDNVIMDRCIVDGFVYTSWLYNNDKVTNETRDYAWNTFNDIINDIDIILYCLPVEMVDDGQRSTNTEFQAGIDSMMSFVLTENPWDLYKGKLITLDNKDVEKRFEDVKIAIAEHEHTTT